MSTTNVKENPKPNYEIPGSQLYVSRPGLLLNLLLHNKISVSRFWLLIKIIFFSLLSYPLQLLQRVVLFFSLKRIDLKKSPPVFILGHWRSGTTHVHYTLALDKQFAFLTNFQSFFFNICMLGLGWLDKLLAPLTPKKRPQDNMEFSVFKPQEEENVISNFSVAAGVHSFYFPKNRSYFNKYNLFKGISKREKRIWQRDYTFTLKALSKMSDNKKLLLKNPNNTGRIKQLLELYPDAKFVFIHRNPYQVYLSTKHLHRTVLRGQRLQEITNEEEDAAILENYQLIMRQYLETRSLIPANNLVELSYDEIGSKGEIERYQQIYEQFNLDGWEGMKDKVETYLASKSSYKKNKFVPIDAGLVEQIKEKWGFAFDEFGYPKSYMADMASKN